MNSVKAGKAPSNKARQGNPKAKPGRPGNILAIATSVTAIVMFNKNIPRIPTYGALLAKAINGAEVTRAVVETETQP